MKTIMLILISMWIWIKIGITSLGWSNDTHFIFLRIIKAYLDHTNIDLKAMPPKTLGKA